MSSVLHPVGPESKQIYWKRRVAVLVAAIIVLAVLIAVVVNSTSQGSAVQDPPRLVDPTPTSAPTHSPTPSARPTASPRPTAARSAAPTAAQRRGQGQVSAVSTPTLSPKPTPTPVPTSTSATKVVQKVGPVRCAPTELKATLKGKRTLKAKQAATFSVAVTNVSEVACIAAVSGKNFELKIYSGRDRIWSTDDCSTAVKTAVKTLAAGQALEWKQTWDGRRSKADCKRRPETPRSGTYFATAQYKGAKPVQQRLLIG